jgi:hypothetical protein
MYCSKQYGNNGYYGRRMHVVTPTLTRPHQYDNKSYNGCQLNDNRKYNNWYYDGHRQNAHYQYNN